MMTRFLTMMIAVDLVTETDKAVENFISSELRQKYPDYECVQTYPLDSVRLMNAISFIGEETYIPGKSNLTEKPTFIVDPIDGTTNFVHSFPYVSISLGFAVNYIPHVGVIYNPFIGQLY